LYNPPFNMLTYFPAILFLLDFFLFVGTLPSSLYHAIRFALKLVVCSAFFLCAM